MIHKNMYKYNSWAGSLLIIVLVISLTLNDSLVKPLYAQGTVILDKIEVTLEPGKCTNETVTITTDPIPVSKLDLALVIDVTSSMGSVIAEVTRNASTIMADTRALVPDTAFALGTFSDYQAGFGGLAFLVTPYGGPGDYPWRLDQDFTTDENALQTALNNIELLFGGDGNESYLRALYETEFLSWRNNSRRIVILFGDSLPHDPDPGVDFTLDTDDDLTQSSVIEQLAKNDISVITVYTVSSTEPFYQAIADGTGGEAFFLQRTEDIPQIIQQLVESKVTSIQTLTLVPTYPGNSWMTWQPETLRNMVSLEPNSFSLELCVPEDTQSGNYTFDLNVLGDGVIINQLPVLVHVVEADLSIIQKVPSDPVFVEDELTYLVTVSNNGTLPATNIVLIDELPSEAEFISASITQGICTGSNDTVVCNLFSLANGASATATILVRPTRADTAINKVRVIAKEHDPDQSNNFSGLKTIINPDNCNQQRDSEACQEIAENNSGSVTITQFDYQILQPNPDTIQPIHPTGFGCFIGSQILPLVAVQVINVNGQGLDQTQLEELLSDTSLVPVANLIAPDGTVEEIAFELIESPEGPQLVAKAQSIPPLAGEYEFDVLFKEGSTNSRFVPVDSSRSVAFFRHESWLTNPSACRGIGLTGTIVMGLLILTGGFFLSPPIGTLALIQAGTSDKLAGSWVLRRYRRLQKIRSKQLERFGIQEIILSKVKPVNSNTSGAIKIRARDLGGKWFITDKILHPSDNPQPFVDEIDIRYE